MNVCYQSSEMSKTYTKDGNIFFHFSYLYPGLQNFELVGGLIQGIIRIRGGLLTWLQLNLIFKGQSVQPRVLSKLETRQSHCAVQQCQFGRKRSLVSEQKGQVEVGLVFTST